MSSTGGALSPALHWPLPPAGRDAVVQAAPLGQSSEESGGIGIAVCVFIIVGIVLAAIFLLLVVRYDNCPYPSYDTSTFYTTHLSAGCDHCTTCNTCTNSADTGDYQSYYRHDASDDPAAAAAVLGGRDADCNAAAASSGRLLRHHHLHARPVHEPHAASADKRDRLREAQEHLRKLHSHHLWPLLRHNALRRLLGEDEERKKHKVFVGVGYRYLNETNAWSALTYTAANLATKDVDIVVIITTYLMPEGRHDCITLPVNAMKSPNPYTPALEDASNLAKEGFASPSTIVAFTLQMGVPYYILTKQYGRPIDAMYEPCRMFGLTDYSQACQAHTVDLNLEKAVIGLNNAESATLFDNRNIFQSHDTLTRMKEKAEMIMSRSDTRVNFTWLLWNVHLTDVTRTCLTGGPFERVKGFRDFFYHQAQLPKG
ncbi:uncharacterized protein LOC142765953 [Rhipicephalus microplus]|uniref:uncharacterized protein LOC142765953 n=1 Tax=Rhipicephalus microplus TaxID=6941 RepID=UPI003F6C5906